MDIVLVGRAVQSAPMGSGTRQIPVTLLHSPNHYYLGDRAWSEKAADGLSRLGVVPGPTSA